MDNAVEKPGGSSVDRTIGRNVAAEIARQGARSKHVAAYVGISPQSFSARTSGVTPFSVAELLAVADYLGVDILVLLGQTLPPPAHNPRSGNFRLVTTPMYQGTLFAQDGSTWVPQLVKA